MTRRVLYMAYPLAPTAEELRFEWETQPRDRVELASVVIVKRNIDFALRWLAWLRAAFSQDTFIAPWIATIMSLHGDDHPTLRAAGMRDNCAVVERCDGIVLCGPRVSSGMADEVAHWVDASPLASSAGLYDLTALGMREPPVVIGHGLDLDTWVAATGRRSGAREEP